MKKIIFIGLVVLFLGSCSVDSDNLTSNLRTEFVPISTVEMPETFELGQTYVINYTYNRPSTCHTFRGMSPFQEGNEWEIAIVNNVITGNGTNCEALSDEIISRSFDFNIDSPETYYFKFWQGLGENDEDLFLEFEVPVN